MASPRPRVATCLAQAAARTVRTPARAIPALPLPLRQRRANSSTTTTTETTPPAPPLLQKLKGGLKAAMRAKDAARLTVLRSVLSATLNASKTASPIATDAQLVALLKKTRASSLEAAGEFTAAGRADLADGERAQVAVLDEYVAGSGVQELDGNALRDIVAATVQAAREAAADDKVRIGDVMKKLLVPGGPLDGKSFDKAELAKVVKEAVA